MASMGSPSRTNRLAPVMKIMLVKSTCFIRDSVIVELPHSRSMLPSATLSKRLSAPTGTYFTASSAMPSSAFTASAMRRQRSME